MRKTDKQIPKRPFGETNHPSSAAIFGGYALNTATVEETRKTLGILQEYGVNHIDTAPSYGDSEVRIGKWMEHHRDAFFLATKIDKRTYTAAKNQIQRSLERLQVKRVDLIQFHNLTDPEEWETVFSEDGALTAAIEARESGLVRFIGVTGHGLNAPKMHLRSLDEFALDSVLLPLNYPLMQNPKYAKEFKTLLERCHDRGVAVQTIKSIAQRRWREDEESRRNTWYKPLEEQSAIDLAVHWVLSHPQVFVITAGDRPLLPNVLEAASCFKMSERPSNEEMRALIERKDMEALW
ncbi:MAG: aldo/keto reductase [Candidatus Korarchaeota archaeon]|nr:aldo/keto reductase [Candidatus Korarchaeota archaeon]NIU83514.1 aldo/keto reductase [Candidatus Thorarchaeota archaeon]NIW13778.1 aldo/keto reductase [Candidatus Thorarchaeota archaeon]NIW51907.1 aldo/keto reductase [Candidatus Korarchaeota archaeon]